jgi:hypothetical protein
MRPLPEGEHAIILTLSSSAFKSPIVSPSRVSAFRVSCGELPMRLQLSVSPNRNVVKGQCGYEITAVENAVAEGTKRER